MFEYDPKKVTLSVGTHQVRGFAEDSMIRVNYNDAGFEENYDYRGTVTRFKKIDKGVDVTLFLTQLSESNVVLHSFFEADRVSNAGVFTLYLKDNNSSLMLTGLKCYIRRLPVVEFSNQNQNREWLIHCTTYQSNS